MSKVLFVACGYYPTTNILASCVRKVAEALAKKNVDVHVLDIVLSNNEDCPKSFKSNNVTIHQQALTHPNRFFDILLKKFRLYGLLFRAKNFFFRLIYGRVTKTPLLMQCEHLPQVLCKQISILNRYYSYNAVVATSSPFLALVGAYLYKRKNGKANFIAYMLDGLSDLGASWGFSAEYLEKLGYKWENKIYSICDRVIQVDHKAHYSRPPFNRFLYKTAFAGIPLIQKFSGKTDYVNPFDTNSTNLVYTGYYYLERASCSYSLMLFKHLCKLPDSISIRYHFYGYGEGEALIDDYCQQTNGRIVNHGRVAVDDLPPVLSHADALVNFGNKSSNQISGKIFEYMSTGSKIIHFQQSKTDVCIKYYSKYPNVLILYEDDCIEENAQTLLEFLKKPSKSIAYEELAEIFPESVPEHTAGLIYDLIGEE